MSLDPGRFRNTLLPSKASNVWICTSLFLFSLGLTTTQVHADTLDKTTHSEENVTSSKNDSAIAPNTQQVALRVPGTASQEKASSSSKSTPTPESAATAKGPQVVSKINHNQDQPQLNPNPDNHSVQPALSDSNTPTVPSQSSLVHLRSTATDVNPKDARNWIHSRVLEDWIEQTLSDSGVTVDHTNLWQHVNDPLRLSDEDYPLIINEDDDGMTDPDGHSTTTEKVQKITDLTGLERFTNLTSFVISDARSIDPQALLNLKHPLSSNLTQFELDNYSDDGSDLDWKISAQQLIDHALPQNSKLVSLRLSGLGLTGGLPDISNFPNLSILDLSANQLSGHIKKLPTLAKENQAPESDNFYPQPQHIYLDDNQFSGVLPPIPTGDRLSYSDNHFEAGLMDSLSSGASQDIVLTQPIVVSQGNSTIKLTSQIINAALKGMQDPVTGQIISTTFVPIRFPGSYFIHEGVASEPTNYTPVGPHDEVTVYPDKDGDSLLHVTVTGNTIADTLTADKNTPSDVYWLTVQPMDFAQDDNYFSANIYFTLDNQMNPRPVTPPTPVDPENPDIPTPPTTPLVPVTPATKPENPTPVQPVQPAPSQPTPQTQTAGQGDHGTTATKPGRPVGQGTTITPQRPRPTTPRPQRSHPRTVVLRRTSRHATALTRSSRVPQSVAQLPQTNESTAHRLQLISLGLLTLTGALLWRKRS